MSMMVTSCPSLAIMFASVAPTLPHPIINMRIGGVFSWNPAWNPGVRAQPLATSPQPPRDASGEYSTAPYPALHAVSRQLWRSIRLGVDGPRRRGAPAMDADAGAFWLLQ